MATRDIALAEPGTNGKVKLTAEVGSSGLHQYGGWVSEEFDVQLRGIRGVKQYDEMRKSDPTVAVGLRAIGWVLGQVNWSVHPGGDTPADEEAAQFLETCMGDMSIAWSKLIRDALTMIPFGWAYMEWTLKQRNGSEADPPSRHDDGKLGWRKLSLIGQDSLQRWDIDPDGGIRGIVQLDIYNEQHKGSVHIPIEKAVLFRLEDEKNNPEGVSLLRPVWLPYYMKKNLQEIEAIGIERDLTGVLIIHLPVNATVTDKEKAMQLLEQFKADDMSGFVAPVFGSGDHERWRFEIINSPGSKSIDPDKVIQRYQHEIARSFLTQFLMLGQGTSGSWALGRDQREMFEVALGAILKNLEETMNRFLVPPLFRVNDFGRITALPELRAGRISKGDMEAFSTSLASLVDSGVLTPGRELEEYVREEMDLPELPEEEEVPEAKPTEDTGTAPAQKAHEFAEGDSTDTPTPYDDAAEAEVDAVLREMVKSLPKPKGLAERLRRFGGPSEVKRTPKTGPSPATAMRKEAQKQQAAWLQTRAEGKMADLGQALREGKYTVRQWAERSKAEIELYTRSAHKLGLAQAKGVLAPGDMHLTEANRMAANKAVQKQLEYFKEFKADVQKDLKAGKELTTAVDQRAKSYGGSVKGTMNGAAIGATDGAKMLKWIRLKSDSCETCISMEGRVQTAEEWDAGGILPGQNTECRSNCGCELSES